MRETHRVSQGVAFFRQGRPRRHADGAGLVRLAAPKAARVPKHRTATQRRGWSVPLKLCLCFGIVTTLGVGAFGGAPAQAQSSVTFRGIYEFAGGNTKVDATDPDLAGVVLTYYWSQIEPQKGVFNWSPIES